jgi:hypothetical protein
MDHSHPAPEGSRAGPLPELPESVAVPEQVAEAAERASRGGGLAATFRIDIAPLRRSREFRLLFVGQGVSFFGSMVTYVALPYQAYRISHSSLIVGLLSLAELIPLLITAFVGGALADAVDRRRMVRLTESTMCLVTGALVVNSLSGHPRLWVLFVVAFAAAGIDGLQRPSLDAMVPRLVTAEELPAAAAISSLKGTLGMVAGPAVAGVLIVAVGLPITYGVDVATFFVSLMALALMRAVPPPPESEGLSLRAVADGLRLDRFVSDRHECHVLRDPDCVVPPGREPPRGGGRARRPLRGAVGRLAVGDSHERMGSPCATQRPRGRALRGDMGIWDHRLRLC